MILFLYGPDTYRSLRKMNEIISSYQKIHKSGLNLIFFNKEELVFEKFKETLFSHSMFGEKKLVVLKNVFSNNEFKEKFLKEKEKFLTEEKIILIYENKDVSEDDELFNFLIKKAKSQRFELLENEKLKKWVKKEFLLLGVKIDNKALDRLLEFVGNNLWQMSNEIKKLVNYKKYKTITESDVRLLIKPKIEPDIFKTIDAIALKSKIKAVELLHKHLEVGDDPLYLLSMVNFQFRNLLIVKDFTERRLPYYSILKKTRLKPFLLKKSYQQAQRFSFPEIKKIYQKIFETNLNIKTGRIEPETALDLLIAEI